MSLRGIRFCKDCANILYAKEQIDVDRGDRRLIYSCRICDYTEIPSTTEEFLVYHRRIRRTAEHLDEDYKDYPLDPTFTRVRDSPCPKCGNPEAIIFHSERETGEAGMRLTYVCTYRDNDDVCGYSWQQV